MVNIKQHKHSGVAMEIPSESMAVESREGSSHLGSALSGEASSETMVTVKEEPLSDCYQYNEYISRDADPGESQYPNVSHVIKQECLPEHQGAKDKSAISEGRNFHNDSAVVKHECMENYQMVADKSSLCEVIKTETVWGDGDSVFHVVNEQECEEYDDCSGSDSDTEAVQYHQDCQTVKRYVFPKHQLVQNQSALSDNCGNGKIIAAATKLPINTEEKPFTCDVCGKQLKYAFLLKRHVKIHTDEKPFKCEFCNKEFRQLCRLRRHMKIHSGEKPFKCVLCKKEFGEAAKLNRHIKTHMGEKPFKCDLCNKEFGEAGKLRRHMRTHTGEKPFTCDLCDRKFQQSNSLRSHMRTHTGETPFRCNLCDKQFRYSGTVIKHMRTHTGEKPFKCHVCGRQFAESCNLTKHVRAKHPQNGNQVIKI